MPGLACYLALGVEAGGWWLELEGLGRTEDKGWRLKTTETYQSKTQIYVWRLGTLRGGRVWVENLLKESSDSEESEVGVEEEVGVDPREVL